LFITIKYVLTIDMVAKLVARLHYRTQFLY